MTTAAEYYNDEYLKNYNYLKIKNKKEKEQMDKFYCKALSNPKSETARKHKVNERLKEKLEKKIKIKKI